MMVERVLDTRISDVSESGDVAEVSGQVAIKSEFWINRLNYSLFFMPRNVFPRMHAKCNALAQTSFESTRKHTKFMKNLFFPLGRHRSGRRRTCASTFDMDVNVNMNVNVNTNIYI
jgi:hypothetical protein